MQDIVIIGAGGFGREVEELISEINASRNQFNLLGFIDSNPEITLNGNSRSQVIGPVTSLAGLSNVKAVIAIGDPIVRKMIFDQLKDMNIELQSIFHPSSIISPSSKIGDGTILCAFTFVGTNSCIEENVVMNVYSSLGHDAIIGSNSVISPYSALTGNVRVGDVCFIGTHSTISPSVEIGDYSKVSSGSMVSKNCEPGSLLSGNPARGRIMFPTPMNE